MFAWEMFYERCPGIGGLRGVSVWGEIWKQMAPEFLWLWPSNRKFCLLGDRNGLGPQRWVVWIYVHSALLLLLFWGFWFWGRRGVGFGYKLKGLVQKCCKNHQKSQPRKSHSHYYYSCKSLSNYMYECGNTR